MLAQKLDDLELQIECPGRAARAGRLRREVKRCGTTRPQTAIGLGTVSEQLAHRACTPRTYRPMKGRGSAPVGMVHERAVLNQHVDDRDLGRRIPGAAGTSPRIARVVEWSRRAAG